MKMAEDSAIHHDLLQRIPPCLDWGVDEVCNWLHSIGKSKYENVGMVTSLLNQLASRSSTDRDVVFCDVVLRLGQESFRENFITGRRLICLHASGLCRLGVTDFQDIMFICRELRKVLWIHTLDLNTEPCLRNPRLMYIQQKQCSGRKIDSLTYKEFKKDFKAITDHTVCADSPERMLPRQDFLRRLPTCPWPDLRQQSKFEKEAKLRRTRGSRPPKRVRLCERHGPECILCLKLDEIMGSSMEDRITPLRTKQIKGRNSSRLDSLRN